MGFYTKNQNYIGNSGVNNRPLNLPLIGSTGSLFSFTTFTFTSAGLCGRFGPTFASLTSNATYSAQPWTSNAAFFSQGRAQGYQVWQPPISGIYEIEVAGARGQDGSGSTPDRRGRGAIVRGNFTLSTGYKLEMVVGQIAGSSVNIASATTVANTSNAGAGGGSFVVLQGTSTPVIIAGGGGGNYSTWTTQAIINGQTRERPRWDGYAISPLVLGTHPAIGGGGTGYHGGGGGGLLTAGQPYTSPTNYTGSAGVTADANGGQSTTHGASFIGGSVDNAAGTWYATGGFPNSSSFNTNGGFGGGGAGHSGNNTGGGGGGYSGGHGGQTVLVGGNFASGTGGGSYIDSTATAVATSDGVYNTSGTFNGSAITNIASFNDSNGYIKITFLG